MDKNAIKKYAVWARRELIGRVSQRAMLYGITAQDAGDPDAVIVNGRPLSGEEKRRRLALIRDVRENGYEQVMEKAAYTWFNRFAALRFMEVNGYLPSHVRVFTNQDGAFKPEILDEAINLKLDGLDMGKVYELEDANKREELYKYLLVTQCDALNAVLPGMFGRVDDYAELLFPDNLLREGSVIERMVSAIPEDDWKDQVQIIGWLYQYYNTEPKDRVFADLKRNIKISKEKIPAATQLFTPDWIVRYMAENSLGRLWLEGRPNDALKAEWKYYLDEAEQTPEVRARLDELRKDCAALTPEDIRVIDPCMGSGHILCVLFDMLVRIYESYGYTAREAASKIVQYNLWGLDIDERAAQLAYFAVMMKARRYDRRFFSRKLQPHVYAPKGYPDGEEFGALITVDELEPEPSGQLAFGNSVNRWNFRHALAQKYHVVITNPPYMGASGMGGTLSKFVKDHYPDSKSDLFAVFMERCGKLTQKYGYQAMITQHAWMFLSSYEKLRVKLQTVDIVNMAHLGPRAFEDIGGEVVQTSSFVFRNSHIAGYAGTYCRLIEPTTQDGKEVMFLAGKNRYTAEQDNFSKIPGAPVAYWASEKARSAYQEKNLDLIAQPRHGLATSDNDRFLKLWYEVDFTKTSAKIRCDYSKKWFPMSKGGNFRKWYGNLDWLINYENNGKEIKDYAISIYKCSSRTIQNTQFYFREGLTWSALTSGGFSVRWQEKGALFGSGGYCAFANDDSLLYILALMNSKVTGAFIQFVSPTLNYEVGHIKTIPVLIDGEKKPDVELIVKNNIALSRADWDAFETSWDFQRCPLIRPVSTIAEAFRQWETECAERFDRLKANEEALNRIFIDIYGLREELSPDVDDKDVTVRKADLRRDVRGFVSYAVGCMFGRYSLDVPGLACAGGAWDASKYAAFPPVPDDIIPICDDEYFEDDMTGRFVRFVETVYGKETLEENLRFIADALGGKGASRAVIRGYFLNGFYADHLKTYQKRPIYWLFDSGRRNGFKCLVYMHRYQPDTIARIRTDYVHEQQSRYRTALLDLEKRMENASASERVKLSKGLSALRERAEEIRLYEEKIHHLADRMIAIDLDDGVKRNYEKFADVLAKIK